MAREIRTMLNGDALALIVDGACLGTAHKAAVGGWMVKARQAKPWTSVSKIGNLAGRPTNVRHAANKREARKLLETL